MRNVVFCLALSGMLIGLGWTVGRAQPSRPDFELFITAPAGETVVECRRGCDLSWIERGLNPNSGTQPTFNFRCSGLQVEQCQSGVVGGRLRR